MHHSDFDAHQALTPSAYPRWMEPSRCTRWRTDPNSPRWLCIARWVWGWL